MPEQAEHPEPRPQILGVGTATPPTSYSQQDILDMFEVTDRKIRMLFLNSMIERRYLTLPFKDESGKPRFESQGDLLAKHTSMAVQIGAQAIERCLDGLKLAVRDLDYLCCTTTTGFLSPGLSALLCRKLGIPTSCGRLDIVGMGCHAGLNGLNAVTNWAASNRDRVGLLLCVEICSAAYVFDGTINTAVVNSLFGDGAAAAVVMASPTPRHAAPQLLKFASCIVPEAIDAMRFTWDTNQGKNSFFLDRDVPYMVGAHAEQVVDQLLRGTGLRRSDITHWIIHSGGKKVIDSVKVNLGLSNHDVRHTISVLRDYGNLSSGSFLFSFERLVAEDRIRAGDRGVLMTMGPGLTIEMALLQW